jgi:hypothetical protein
MLLGKNWREVAVDFLVTAEWHMGVQIAKPDVDFQPARQLRVADHLAATVVSHRPAQHAGQAFHLAIKPVQCRVGGATAHLVENEITGLALDDRRYGRAIEGALDQIAFSVTGHQTGLDIFVPVDDPQ